MFRIALLILNISKSKSLRLVEALASGIAVSPKSYLETGFSLWYKNKYDSRQFSADAIMIGVDPRIPFH